jgi:hypothetical protein
MPRRVQTFIPFINHFSVLAEMRRSAQSLARRLASPFFLPAASTYQEVLTVAQLDKADAA